MLMEQSRLSSSVFANALRIGRWIWKRLLAWSIRRLMSILGITPRRLRGSGLGVADRLGLIR